LLLNWTVVNTFVSQVSGAVATAGITVGHIGALLYQ
jgi:hypothetical protein